MRILKEILSELRDIRKVLLSIKDQQERKNKNSDVRKQGVNPW